MAQDLHTASVPAGESEDAFAGVWREYAADREGRTDLRDRLVEHYFPCVVEIADRMIRRLPSYMDVQDIVSAGSLGLLDAIQRFRPELAIRFETFSQPRIKGAIKDELRRGDWAPRPVRNLSNRISRERALFESRHGRPPGDEEMADLLNVDPEEFQEMRRESQVHSLVPLDRGNHEENGKHELNPMETLPDTRAVPPLEDLVRQETKAETLKGLSEDEKNVLLMYYDRDLSLKEIGKALGKSESRVCQIHGNVLDFIRRRHEQALARHGATNR